MQRRELFRTGLAAGAAAAAATYAPAGLAAALAPAVGKPCLFDVTTTIDLVGNPDVAEVWLPVLQSDVAYQRKLDTRWDTAGRARLRRDPQSGANYLHIRWPHGDGPKQVSLVERVATWERMPATSATRLSHADRAAWTRSTGALPTDGIVGQTARTIVGGLTEPRAKARKIYDWVVANTWRDARVAGCGTGDAAAMLRSGSLGGKCADINSLMVSLCRAADIPARDVYGIRVAPSEFYRSLGRAGDVSGAQHCRAEIYLDDTGWTPVDPADVRKAILEEGLFISDPGIVQLADRLFGHWENNWAAYNCATGFAPAGLAPPGGYDFLMYPTASLDGTLVNCIKPSDFAYTIRSTPLDV